MIDNFYPGKFIVIEGIDGSGKSVQLDLLVKFLKENKKEVVATKEPTDQTEASRKIREVLNGQTILPPLELQKLYIEDRKWHLENEVIPALKEGKIVISSRYIFSTLAYGNAEGIDLNLLIALNQEFLLPDLTIILEVSLESCLERIEKRGEGIQFFEKREKLKKVLMVYKKLPFLFKNTVVIDGERSIEEVSKDIQKIIKEKIL